MKMTSARRNALAILLGAALLAAPQAAVASPPTIEKLGPPADQHYDLPKGQACPGFGLLVDLTDSQTRTKVFKNGKGEIIRTIEAGLGYERTYTNKSTGKKVVFPSKFFSTDTKFHKNGLRTVTSTGRFGLILFPTDVPPGPSTTEYVGRVVYTATPTNDFTIKSTKAKEIDVCALLSKKPRS